MPRLTPEYRQNTVIRLVATIMALCAVVFICVQPQVSNDFWLQAKVGQIITQNGAIPTTVLFPFTEAQSQPFNAHEWLPSVLFYYVVETFGEKSLPLLLGVAGVALFVLTVWLATQRGSSNFALGLLCGLIAMGVENYRHFLRPELLSLFLFLVFWRFLDAFSLKPSAASTLGLLFTLILWTNSHGSFILGPILIAIYAISAGIDYSWRKQPVGGATAAHASYFCLLFIASVGGCLINPMGLDLFRFVFDFGHSSTAKANVVEWFSTLDPRIQKMPGIWIGLTCAYIAGAMCAVRWRTLRTVDCLIFLFFIALGLHAVRFLVYQGFVAAFLIPTLWAGSLTTVIQQRALYFATATLSCLILIAASQFGNANGNFPHKSNSAEALSAPMIAILSTPTLQGNVFNSYDLGAELVYRTYPRMRPSIDSRIDSYGEDYFEYHERLLTDVGLMQAFVSKYQVRYMLLTHADYQSLQPYLKHDPEIWYLYAADRRAVLLQQINPSR